VLTLDLIAGRPAMLIEGPKEGLMYWWRDLPGGSCQYTRVDGEGTYLVSPVWVRGILKWECDCPHWQYRCRKTWEPCKHIRSHMERLKLLGTREVEGG
jgi:hypothetical protein